MKYEVRRQSDLKNLVGWIKLPKSMVKGQRVYACVHEGEDEVKTVELTLKSYAATPDAKPYLALTCYRVHLSTLRKVHDFEENK